MLIRVPLSSTIVTLYYRPCSVHWTDVRPGTHAPGKGNGSGSARQACTNWELLHALWCVLDEVLNVWLRWHWLFPPYMMPLVLIEARTWANSVMWLINILHIYRGLFNIRKCSKVSGHACKLALHHGMQRCDVVAQIAVRYDARKNDWLL